MTNHRARAGHPDESGTDRTARFRRFESPVANGAGTFPGIFALLNGLHRDGLLTDADRTHRDDLVRRSYELHHEPAASYYAEPGARSWFKDSAVELLDLARDIGAVLDRYEVAWVEIVIDAPGRIVYEDAVQVVAVQAVSGSCSETYRR